MSEAEILRIIHQTVRQALAPILMGSVTGSDDVNRLNTQRFQTDSTQVRLRNIQPYGVASRPPPGMACLIVPMAGDPTNQAVVGQFDEKRPEVAEGEVAFYGPAGQMIWFKNDGSIYQGAGGDASEPIVLGSILAAAVKAIVKAFTAGAPIGIDSLGGPVQLHPSVKAELEQYLTMYVDDPETNFLSQKNFVERE